MAKEEVKILGAWSSPFVMRPRIALNLKGVKYEFLEEVLGAKSELLLKLNPVYKKIPVMIHNEKTVNESMIIVVGDAQDARLVSFSHAVILLNNCGLVIM
ncbi:uncharacterized protein A4U43_C07F12220 [Asparagus officinalis]|uniref:Glutathione S-transferase n=1 Tax=Asparagus officinalis TaxID=4686 RepID=A0A5P1EED2_ASPOF|nr:uncharacterized protein A4U43_C07F12220 [Asparagus officinalis]